MLSGSVFDNPDSKEDFSYLIFFFVCVLGGLWILEEALSARWEKFIKITYYI